MSPKRELLLQRVDNVPGRSTDGDAVQERLGFGAWEVIAL